MQVKQELFFKVRRSLIQSESSMFKESIIAQPETALSQRSCLSWVSSFQMRASASASSSRSQVSWLISFTASAHSHWRNHSIQWPELSAKLIRSLEPNQVQTCCSALLGIVTKRKPWVSKTSKTKKYFPLKASRKYHTDYIHIFKDKKAYFPSGPMQRVSQLL